MRNKKRFLPILILATSIFLIACGNSENKSGSSINGSEAEKNETITFASTYGPYGELFLDAIVPILEKQGYTIKEQNFADVRSVDIALEEEAVDVNVDQHLAYMENFNEETGGNLTAITPTPTVPTGLYSDDKESIDDVEKGDKVGIPQDASNTARALLLLEKAGWLKLDSSVDPIEMTQADIIENMYDLDIVDMDSVQIPRSLEDLDFGVIPGSVLFSSGLTSKVSLLDEDILPKFVLHVVVKDENKETEWAKDIAKAYKSKEFLEYMEKENTDNYWFIPDALTK